MRRVLKQLVLPTIGWNYPSDSGILGGMMGCDRMRKIVSIIVDSVSGRFSDR